MSCAAAARLRTWWDTNPPALEAMIEMAARVNEATAPLVLTDAEPAWVLVLARLLRPDVLLQVSPAPTLERRDARRVPVPAVAPA